MGVVKSRCWMCKDSIDDGVVRLTGMCDGCRIIYDDDILGGVRPPGMEAATVGTTYFSDWVDAVVSKAQSRRFADDTGWYAKYHPENAT